MFLKSRRFELSFFMVMLSLSIIVSPALAASNFKITLLTKTNFSGNSGAAYIQIAGDNDEIFLARSNGSGPGLVEIYNRPTSYTSFPMLNKSYTIASDDYVYFLHVAANGKRFLTGVDTYDKISMYSRDSQSALWSYEDIFANYERCNTFSMNMELVGLMEYISATSELNIAILNGSTGAKIWDYDISTHSLSWGLTLSADGSLVTYSARIDSIPTILGFDALTGALLWQTELDTVAYDLVQTSTGKYIAARDSGYQKIMILNGSSGAFIRNLTISEGAFAAPVFSADGNIIFTSTYNSGGVGNFAAYDLTSTSLEPLWETELDIGCAEIKSSSNEVLIGSLFDGKIALVDQQNGEILLNDEIGEPSHWSYNSLAVSVSGNLIGIVNNYYSTYYSTALGIYSIESLSSSSSGGDFLESLKNTFTMDNLYGLAIVGVVGLILGLLLRGKKK